MAASTDMGETMSDKCQYCGKLETSGVYGATCLKCVAKLLARLPDSVVVPRIARAREHLGDAVAEQLCADVDAIRAQA